jgi:hypothetical protein
MDDPRAIVDAILQRVLSVHGHRQIFLFGPTGEPFWAARLPVSAKELVLLDIGMRLLQEVERTRERPFVAYEPRHDLFTTALDAREDLYVVVLQDSRSGAPAEAVVRLKAALSVDLPALRTAVSRLTRAS